MKKLTTLILGGLLMINSVFGFEENPYKYIPKSEHVRRFDFKEFYIYLWDKNKDKKIQSDEIFFDLNRDTIVDFSYEELLKEYLSRLEIKKEMKDIEKRLAKID